MILTPFDRKIIFKVSENLTTKVEMLVETWDKIIKNNPKLYARNYPLRIIPLKPTRTYAFDASWGEPFAVAFNNWASNKNSAFLYIEKESDIEVLEAYIKLNYYSRLERTTPEEKEKALLDLKNSALEVVERHQGNNRTEK